MLVPATVNFGDSRWPVLCLSVDEDILHGIFLTWKFKD